MAYNSSHTGAEIDNAVTKALALPTITSSDNGKFLKVVNGAWAVVEVPNASGVRFG